MGRTARRLTLGVTACLALVLGTALLPGTPATADTPPDTGPECMFFGAPPGMEGGGCDFPVEPPATQSVVAPADDRLNATPTAWWTYQNISPESVSSLLSANGARPTDLRVLSASPLRFSVTMVRNSGAYASGYWWYYGITMGQVNSYLSANNARLISAVRYGNVYAVVMVPNTGANAKAWGWCDTDYNGVVGCLGNANRLTNIEAYAQNGFVVIFVNNSENYGWCWYVGISRASVNSVCGGQSIVDLSVNPDGTVNIAAAATGTPAPVGDFVTATDLVVCAVNGAQRSLFVSTFPSGGSTRWIGSFVSNA